MAEQYQLPGQFQAPSMAEVSYVAGDQQAGDNANWKMFTEQINAYTNINNANRLASFRERQFAEELALRQREFDRKISEGDRDFMLRRELQDANLRNNNLNYEVSKFNLDKTKEQYGQLQDAWQNYPQLKEEIAGLLPNGGNVPNWGRVRSQIRAQYAKNPAQALIVDQILADYDQENKIFSDNKVLEDQAQVQSWLEGGDYLIDEFDDQGNVIGSKPIMIGDQTAEQVYSEALLEYTRGNQVGYLAKMAPLKRIGNQRQQMREAAQTIQQAGAIEKATGVPIYQIKATDKGIETVFQPPRVYASRGAGAGTEGVKTLSEADVKLLREELTNVDTQIAEIDSKLAEVESPIQKARFESDKAGLEAKKGNIQRTIDMGVQLIQQKGTTQLPAQPQAPAQGSPTRMTPQSILKPPTFPTPAPKAVTPSERIPVSGPMTITPSGIQFPTGPAGASRGLPVTGQGVGAAISG